MLTPYEILIWRIVFFARILKEMSAGVSVLAAQLLPYNRPRAAAGHGRIDGAQPARIFSG